MSKTQGSRRFRFRLFSRHTGRHVASRVLVDCARCRATGWVTCPRCEGRGQCK